MTQEPNTATTLYPWYVFLARTVGYGLFLMGLLDLIAMFVPFQLMKPVWIFARAGELVDRTAIPLVGVVLIFYGGLYGRRKIERRLLSAITNFCILYGIVLFLTIPVLVGNSIRVDKQTSNDLTLQFNQQMNQTAKVEKALNQITDVQLKQLAAQRGIFESEDSSDSIKDKLLSNLTLEKKNLTKNYEQSKLNQFLTLVKNTIKWILGGIISGFLFIYIGRQCSKVVAFK